MIRFERVDKSYRSGFGKRIEAVRDVSFSVETGEVVGIAGPNGAGKSTLIALMLGLIAPSGGRVSVDGLAPRAFAEHEGIGYLPELIPMNATWRADEAITRLGVLAGVPASELPARVDAVIERVGLTEHRRKKCKQLSKGNLQKVGLAQALLTDQRVYVFDEPTHGLDPMATQQFREIIHGMRRPDRAMLVASHNLDELERMCDRVAIIDHGQVQRMVDLKSGVAPREVLMYRIRVTEGKSALLAAFPGATDRAVGEGSGEGSGEVLIPPLDVATLNRGLARAIADGALIASVNPDRTALEREFHAAVRPAGGIVS